MSKLHKFPGSISGVPTRVLALVLSMLSAAYSGAAIGQVLDVEDMPRLGVEGTFLDQPGMTIDVESDQNVVKECPDDRDKGDSVFEPEGFAEVCRADQLRAERSDVRLIADQNDWGLYETRAHMKIQDIFGDLLERLSKKYPRLYAGGIFAERPGDPSVVRFVGKVPPGAAEDVERSGLWVELQVDAKYSERALQERARKVHDYLLSVGYKEVVTAVTTDDGVIASVTGKRPRGPELPPELRRGVKVTQYRRSVATDEHTRGGARVLDDGTFECTSGFTVRSTTGVNGVLTAGHCNGINQYQQPSNGLVYGLTHQSQHISTFGDVEWKTSPHIEPAQFFARANEIRGVNSVLTFGGLPVNSFSCVYGRSSNLRACDRVFSTFVTVTVNGNTASFLIAMDNDNTIGGDSGGPWSFATIADGIHKGDATLSGGTRNVWSQASLLPLSLGVTVRTQ